MIQARLIFFIFIGLLAWACMEAILYWHKNKRK